MCQILHKKVDGGGCKKYRNRQAKCIARKKDALKFRNIALYKNDYKHLFKDGHPKGFKTCLLYTSDAADEEDSVDLGGRRIIKNLVLGRCPSISN